MKKNQNKKSRGLVSLITVLGIAALVFFGGKAISLYQWDGLNSAEDIYRNVDMIPQTAKTKVKEGSTMKVILLDKKVDIYTTTVNDSYLISANAGSKSITSETDFTMKDKTEANLKELRDEQIEDVLEENGFTMYEYVNHRERIAESVLLEIEKIMVEYDTKLEQLDYEKTDILDSDANEENTEPVEKDEQDRSDGTEAIIQ